VGVKRPELEVYPSPLSAAESKNKWRYTSTPQASSWSGALLSRGTIVELIYFCGLFNNITYRVVHFIFIQFFTARGWPNTSRNM
jgi:hypothetical protein